MFAPLLVLLALLGAPDDPFAEARAAPPAERAAVALAAFREHPELSRAELDSLWSLVTDELAALRLLETEPLVTAIHARYAAPWSAVNLALVLQKLGRYDEVDVLFAETIDGERAADRATGGLVNQWGILALGAGDVRRARRLLERALALGSDDAPCVLGRLDLAEDRPRDARGRVGRLMLAPEPPAWAQRVWGLSLLGPAPDGPR